MIRLLQEEVLSNTIDLNEELLSIIRLYDKPQLYCLQKRDNRYTPYKEFYGKFESQSLDAPSVSPIGEN